MIDGLGKREEWAKQHFRFGILTPVVLITNQATEVTLN